MRNRRFRPCVARLDYRIAPSSGVVITYGPLDPITVGDPNKEYSTADDEALAVDVKIDCSSGQETGYDPLHPHISSGS